MAVQGFEVNSLDPAYQLRLLDGVKAATQSVFKEVFTPEGVAEMSGKVPFIPSKFTLLSNDDSTKTKIGIQDSPDVLDMDLNSTDFSFDGKYAKEARIHKSTVRTLGNKLQGAEDLVQYLGSVAMGFVNSAFDLDAAAILKSTTLNKDVSATAVWTDLEAARPFEDFDKLVDQVGTAGAVLWLGMDKARLLSALPAFRDEDKQFDAKGGRISLAGVAEILRRRYDLSQVVIDGTWYNEANVAQTINKSRIFDGVVWMGDPDHMLVVERSDLREVDSEFDSRTGNFSTWLTEYYDIARAENGRGAVLTGTTT